ncbi:MULTISPECIES: asparaginase [unclassified Leucobacter]|uniref:asparaginase n=1 Tax=unclassified Leucobacter TaxID=2621730 RepID=UPI001F12993C|nr:asparaginase [Leucobacter sp. CX169]
MSTQTGRAGARLPGTTTISDAEQLAVVIRNGFIESRHAGSAVVLGADGEVKRSLGDPSATIYTRSALKPLQSLAMHAAGLVLADDEERAISLASHSGTPGHVTIVQRMLDAGSLAEDQLLCPADWPMGSDARDALLREGGERRRILMCCSGKHAAMLRTCQVNGWSVDGYVAPEHPLQVAIRETVQRFTGEKPSPVGVDGCGAPVLGLSLLGLAKAYRRMATSEANSPFPLHRTAAQLIGAARAEPWVVEGPGRPDTVVSERLGVFAKFGAEGISVIAAPDGTVAVVKVLDGAARAATIVAIELLAKAGALPADAGDQVRQELRLDVWGGGVPVGRIEATV